MLINNNNHLGSCFHLLKAELFYNQGRPRPYYSLVGYVLSISNSDWKVPETVNNKVKRVKKTIQVGMYILNIFINFDINSLHGIILLFLRWKFLVRLSFIWLERSISSIFMSE